MTMSKADVCWLATRHRWKYVFTHKGSLWTGRSDLRSSCKRVLRLDLLSFSYNGTIEPIWGTGSDGKYHKGMVVTLRWTNAINSRPSSVPRKVNQGQYMYITTIFISQVRRLVWSTGPAPFVLSLSQKSYGRSCFILSQQTIDYYCRLGCGHMLCSLCLKGATDPMTLCPVCRAPFNITIIPCNSSFKEFLDELSKVSKLNGEE